MSCAHKVGTYGQEHRCRACNAVAYGRELEVDRLRMELAWTRDQLAKACMDVAELLDGAGPAT